ncbi:MAG: STAS domain-containing protein [Candidatus Omnitrophica bacterium]|nr:STAS domain-containing protein [Candidatus Omnitrophota bacterium]
MAKRKGGIVCVSIRGSIDVEGSAALEKELAGILASATKALILDMGGIDYIGSVGIRVIMTAKKNVEGAGGDFMVTGLQPNVKNVFDILHLIPLVNIFVSVKEAEDALAGRQ